MQYFCTKLGLQRLGLTEVISQNYVEGSGREITPVFTRKGSKNKEEFRSGQQVQKSNTVHSEQ
jgi:hypothetical protein